MAPPRTSNRIGLFTLLLSVIAVLLFASLLATDRALVNSQRDIAELDARSSAMVVGRDLRLRAEALTEFFDPLLPAAGGSPRPPSGFDAVWVVDANGRMVFGAPPSSSEDSAAIARVVAQTTPSSWPATAAIGDTARGLLLSAPLSHRGALLGTAVGRISPASVLASLRTDQTRAGVALEIGGQPLTSTGLPASAAHRRAQAMIPLAGEPIALVIVRSERGQGTRRLLWVLGVIALAALLAGLVRERRHTLSLAARTAELERLYQEVARSNRMKSEFLANISHELRTPLNAIVGFVEMLREGVYGEMTPRQALPVDRIAASATHLRQLVDRLLDIAKIAAGRLEVHVEPITLRPFVLNVASEMESLLSESGLALSIAVPATLPRIVTDQTHLRQILINLIGNAVKYTSHGGIQVRAVQVAASGSPPPADALPPIGEPPTVSGRWVALMVTDTGVGIAPEDQERIFDEFEQVNPGPRTDSARRGTGLGLAISRRLARLLGGEITVASNRGGGSTFTVWLPLEPEAEAGDASPEPLDRTSA